MNASIYESMRYINDHIEEPLSLDDISQHVGYSKYHFSRLFKNAMGRSLKDYIIEIKLIHAVKDILNGSSITTAALKYQYDTHSGFGKAFRKKFGYPPHLLLILRYTRAIFLEEGELVMDTNKLYQELLGCLSHNVTNEDKALIDKAYQFAEEMHRDHVRYSGEPYITFPLNVAIILAKMEQPAAVIVLGLLHECKEEHNIIQVKTIFGNQMVDSIMNLNQVHLSKNLFENAVPKSMEKLLFVKLASRLYNMKTLKFMDEARWKEKAKETLEIFSPIADKLNLTEMKLELDQLSIKYLS